MSSGQVQLVLRFHRATGLPKAPYSLKVAKPYVEAGIVNPNMETTWSRTRTDEKGGKNPEWGGYILRYSLNQDTLDTARNFKLRGKIMHSGETFGPREIGYFEVRLLVLLLGGENIGYPVVSDGKERGRIFISYKLLTTTVPAPLPITTSVPDSPSQDHIAILELIFHRGIDLPHPLLNHKGSPFVRAAIKGLDTETEWIRTFTDEEGGANPEWDYVMRFHLNQENRDLAGNYSVVCKVVHSGKNLGNRKIGHVEVPLQNFLGGSATGENIPYKVKSGGVEKGEIVISHRLVTNTADVGVDVSASPSVGPNHSALPNAVDALKLAASVTTIAAAVYGVVAETT